MIDSNKLDEINSAMQEAESHMQDGVIYNNQMTKARASLSELRDKFNTLKEQLRKEEKDVEKLQSISFTNLFHSLINDKPEKLSKEEQEVLTVKAQIDSLQYEITAAEARISTLADKLSKVADSEKRYKLLFEEKKLFVESQMPERWKEIENFTLQTHGLLLSQKEVKEAINAGVVVLGCIDGIQKSLNSAAGWGTYDMIGGGMISTMIKRDHMNQAQNQIHELTHQLNTFKQEIGDVGASMDINLGINDFLGFADWFFDGFFVDLAVQSKINQARDQIQDLKNRVQNILSHLQNEERVIQAKVIALKNESDAIIKGIY